MLWQPHRGCPGNSTAPSTENAEASVRAPALALVLSLIDPAIPAVKVGAFVTARLGVLAGDLADLPQRLVVGRREVVALRRDCP